MSKYYLRIKNLVVALVIAANLVYVPALAVAETIPTPPTPPSAPSAPVAPVAPTAPTAPTPPAPPVAPVAPVVPTAPTSQATNNNSGNGSTNDSGSSTTNSGNGADSTNNSSNNSSNDTSVVDVNNANVVNDQNVDVKTGSNEADKNMGSATVASGNASVSGGLQTDINNNFITIGDLCGQGCSAGFVDSNLKNGNGTLNNANGSLTKLVILNNTNNLNLTNSSNLGASTGVNSASKNLGDGVIVSGDADVAFTTVNFGNNNGINLDKSNYNIIGDQSEDIWINFPTGTASGAGLGSLGASNIGNGSDSINNAATDLTSTTKIDNNNNLILNNDINLYANTGNNYADKNNGSGNITTGDANIASNVINFLNNNIVAGAKWLLSTINIFGNMTGNIILPRADSTNTTCSGCPDSVVVANTGNGSGSDNTANAISTDNTTINETNNAVIKNSLNLDGTTGGNQTDKNLGNSSISTGDTDVKSNLVTVANTNTVGQGDTWWLVIVNDNGNYTGRILGSDNQTIAGSSLDFGVASDGSIYALNQGNGSDSTNNSTTNSANTTDINNTNNAVINNNINIKANTGDNSASSNLGGGNIKTGDVNVASNIVNFINNNFVGRKFVVTLVNVFGSFSGSIVPPNQPIPIKNSAKVGGVDSVNLPENTTITPSTNMKESSVHLFGQGGNGISLGSSSLTGNTLAESGKLLENAAVTQKVSDQVKKVINTSAANTKGLNLNWIFIGIALLILAGYAFVARRSVKK